MQRIKRHTKKILVGLLGFTVLLIGLVLIPYPGPGWLIVFAGLAILATEFEFASRILDTLRTKYDQWTEWLKQQPWWIKLPVIALTGLVVVLTVWLINGFGLINQFLNLGQDWLISPFFR
jgi:uncharacterized protein (TIGR02611 family)